MDFEAPKLWTPTKRELMKPAILRLEDPWKVALRKKLAKLSIGSFAIEDVIKEVERVARYCSKDARMEFKMLAEHHGFQSKQALLPGTVPLPVFSAVALTYVQSQLLANAASATTYNFSMTGLTSAHDSVIAIFYSRSSAAGARTISAADIDGGAGVINQENSNSAQGVGIVAFINATTTPTINVTFSGGCINAGVFAFTLSGVIDTTAYTNASTDLDPADLDMNVEADMFSVGGMTNVTSDTTYTQTGFDTTFNSTSPEANAAYFGGGYLAAASETPRQFEINPTAFLNGTSAGGTFSL